jgi:hypothetical protein
MTTIEPEMMGDYSPVGNIGDKSLDIAVAARFKVA